MTTLRETILAPRDTPREKVTLEDGVEIWVHGMTAAQAAEHQTFVLDAKGKISFAKLRKQDALTVVLTCRDDNGAALFTRDDIDELQALPAGYLKPAIDAAQRLSGLRSVEDMAKNFEATDDDN